MSNPPPYLVFFHHANQFIRIVSLIFVDSIMLFILFHRRSADGRPGRPKRGEIVANWCRWRKEIEIDPLEVKWIGFQGVLVIGDDKRDGKPVPYKEKSHFRF